MRNDFCAFILTNRRPSNVVTYKTLRKQGYTGKIYIVIDDEDPTGWQYKERFGDDVLVFSKSEIALKFDEGDNFNDRRSIFYARNACFDLARSVGVKYFIQLDDDYSAFLYRIDEDGFFGHWYAPLNWLFSALCDYLEKTPFASVAISQGGDHIGGGSAALGKGNGTKRKAMNTFVCSVDKPFRFVGRVNEDVNTYTAEQRRGIPFLSIMAAQVNQKATQSNSGGMTELYLDGGTYIKTFYSVIYCPSAVKVSVLRDPGKKGGTKTDGHARIHHKVNWDACAPLILRDTHRKPICGIS